jgi:AcrR family transcriptional regulator
MNTTRAYDRTSRAAAMEETRQRILSAVFQLSGEKHTLEIVLSEVADRAETTVQTILRHFGSREGLFDAVIPFAREQIAEERSTPAGDIDAAIAVVHAHYEKRGPWVLNLLAQEHADDRIRQVVTEGRQAHRLWVSSAFRPQLDALPPGDREGALDLLVAATDVYVWSILRRERSAAIAEQRVGTLVRAILRDGEPR